LFSSSLQKFTSLIRSELEILSPPFPKPAIALRCYIQASEKLRIQGLLELACHTLANKIKGKLPQENRTMLNIRAQEDERAM
jgi:hypothetical protein